MASAVIFGGTGFIGTFFAKHLIEEEGFEEVWLYDREPVSTKNSVFRKGMLASFSNIHEVGGDVRQDIEWMLPAPVSLVANFAAIHREPGHENFEYYETNLRGAENICAWAEKNGCEKILFSSSIAPYGLSEKVKDETALPVPATAYGGSKLAAEKIHEIWQAKSANTRQLVIVRPGVVFGPGEGGNVSRLIKAVRRRYFFYMGNQKTRKAGVYVKELCMAMMWVLKSDKAALDGVTLFNMSMNPGPSIEEYVAAIAQVYRMRIRVPSVPYKLLLTVSFLIDFCSKPLGLSHPFSPVRIKKLVRSNNILPSYVSKNGYQYKYTLEEAFVDWMNECPEEWD